MQCKVSFVNPCAVMQRELDKIERYANKVVEQAKMEKPTANKLLSDVKVSVTSA